jgi:hypothetical protein
MQPENRPVTGWRNSPSDRSLDKGEIGMTDYTELKRNAQAASKYDWTKKHLDLSDKFPPDYENHMASCSPSVILALISENERNQRFIAEYSKSFDQLKADNEALKHSVAAGAAREWDLRNQVRSAKESRACVVLSNKALRKDRTDWQAECLKRGFEYVRESDDHYVLADLAEMADLLGLLLGVEVRTKDNDAYKEANSRLNEQVEGLINTIHAQEALRKDAERYRWLRNGGSMPEDRWVEGALACFEDWLDPFYHQPEMITGDDLDQKIDSAMAGSSES